MSIKEYLKVHEIAELFGLNVQTLHYYDKAGILKPNYRDPNNGYRKYKFDQIYQLASIRYMRKLGYSIDAVKDFQNSRNAQETLVRLRERSEAIRKQWEELMKIDEAIMRKIQFIENALPDVRVDEIEILERPERQYIPIGVEEQLYMDESFYFYPTLVLYGGDQKLFGALVTDESSANTSVLPAGRYIVGYHQGPYEDIQKSFDRIRAYGKDYALDEQMLAINIIDQFIEKDSQNYITRIEVKIV